MAAMPADPHKAPWLVMALMFIPISLMVLLSAPAWLSWPFLSERRRRTVLQVVDLLVEWTRALHGPYPADELGAPATAPVQRGRARSR
jgi:hypothetical protein